MPTQGQYGLAVGEHLSVKPKTTGRYSKDVIRSYSFQPLGTDKMQELTVVVALHIHSTQRVRRFMKKYDKK